MKGISPTRYLKINIQDSSSYLAGIADNEIKLVTTLYEQNGTEEDEAQKRKS